MTVGTPARDEHRREIERRSQRKRRQDNPEYFAAARERFYRKDVEKSRKYFRDWAAANRVSVRAAKTKWRLNNKDKIRDANLLKKYGISGSEWDALFESQGRKCAICPSEHPKSKTGWHTDHCHRTGKVRGILCHGCNHALGAVEDSTKTLHALIEYVEAHNADD